jgi:hypothetical protein
VRERTACDRITISEEQGHYHRRDDQIWLSGCRFSKGEWFLAQRQHSEQKHCSPDAVADVSCSVKVSSVEAAVGAIELSLGSSSLLLKSTWMGSPDQWKLAVFLEEHWDSFRVRVENLYLIQTYPVQLKCHR